MKGFNDREQKQLNAVRAAMELNATPRRSDNEVFKKALYFAACHAWQVIVAELGTEERAQEWLDKHNAEVDPA